MSTPTTPFTSSEVKGLNTTTISDWDLWRQQTQVGCPPGYGTYCECGCIGDQLC